MTVIFTTLSSIDDPANVHVGVKVDFDAGTWTIPDNPKGVPLLGTSGQLTSAAIGGGPWKTQLFLPDGATLAIELDNFSQNTPVSSPDDAPSDGLICQAAPDESINVTWLVTGVV